MKTDLILLCTCTDRPGVVESITTAVVKHGGNWEESRLARLAGDFAGLARISLPVEQVEQLTRTISNLDGLEIRVKQAGAAKGVSGTKRLLTCTGADHEGIVHSIASYLASDGINVEEMESSVEHAPISGTPLFNMCATVVVPDGSSVELFEARLSELSTELGVDIETREA